MNPNPKWLLSLSEEIKTQTHMQREDCATRQEEGMANKQERLQRTQFCLRLDLRPPIRGEVRKYNLP